MKRGIAAVQGGSPGQDSEKEKADPTDAMREREANLLRPQLKQISRLRKFQTPLQGKERTEFVNWRTRTSALLWEALGVDSIEASNFDDIEFVPRDFLGLSLSAPSHEYAVGLDEAEAILKTAIEIYLRQPAARREG